MQDTKADSCTVSSGSEITAVYASGYPLSDTAVIPVVKLLEDCNSEMQTLCLVAGVRNEHTVLTDAAAVGIANPLTVTEDVSLAVSCSFAGGCHRTVKAKGLTTSVLND